MGRSLSGSQLALMPISPVGADRLVHWTVSLLVSHWSVDSDATVSLTTGAYREQEAAPGIGRAEALRRAMKTLMGRPGFEHPTFWAPFVVVGEGGAEGMASQGR